MKKGQQGPPDTIRPSLGGTEGFDELFEHARRDAFTPQEAERLWQSVVSGGPGPGGGDAGPDVPGGSTPGWTSGAALKIVAGFVLAGGLVAAFAGRRSLPPEPVAVTNGAVAVAPGTAALRGEGGPPIVAWEDLPRAGGEAKPATRPVKGHGESSAQPPEAVPAADLGSVGAGSVEPAPATIASAAHYPGPSEGALLLRARQQLASDPQAALELTDEAGRRFPDGALAPEREVLAIEALARLGRLQNARSRFAAFRAAYPQSPHLARLASLVGP